MPDLDLTQRYAPTEVVCRGQRVAVEAYRLHPAGGHPSSPIRDDMPALECVTAVGSRWYGVSGGGINSELHMVIWGTNPRDEVRMKWTAVPEDCRLPQP